jgi:predicted nuclease with TOPRIM domain
MHGMGMPPDHLAKMLRDVSLYDFLATMVFIIGVVAYVSSKLHKILESYRKTINEFEEHNAEIKKHSKAISKLKMEDATIHSDISKLNGNVNELRQLLLDMQKKNDDCERARIKNEISKAYQRFHKVKKWSSMEKEAMEDLIEQYEACGGINSFVHKKVQVEMYTWEVTDSIVE